MRLIKNTFSLLSMFMIFNHAAAQDYKGIQIGFNTSSTVNVTNAKSSLLGLNIGGYLGLDRSKKVSPVFELSMRTQGFGDSNNKKVRMYYANAAALMAFQTLKENTKFRILIGAQPTLFIGKSEPNYPNVQKAVYCDGTDCFETPKPLSLDALGGIEYWGRFRYGVRVGYSLIPSDRFRHFYLEFVMGI